MGLPYQRNQSYAPSTAVASDDLNDLQDWEVRGWDAIAGKDLVIAEDFILDIARIPLVQLAGANAAWADDATDDGFGVLSLPPNAGGHETWDSLVLPLSGRRWRLCLRARWKTQPGSINSYCMLGIYTSVGPKPFYWVCTGGAGALWKLRTQAGDTASTRALDGSYHVLDLRCDGASISAVIDGTEVTSVTVPATFNAKMHLDVFRDAGDGACDLYVDSLKLWVAR